jgi:hypothetical protein
VVSAGNQVAAAHLDLLYSYIGEVLGEPCPGPVEKVEAAALVASGPHW